eukprot:scaffold11659_cov89-Skeletonema_dohrnii-CCMP3373.AAC.3
MRTKEHESIGRDSRSKPAIHARRILLAEKKHDQDLAIMAMLVSCPSPLRLGVHKRFSRSSRSGSLPYIHTSLQPDRSEPVEAEAEERA